MSSLDCVDAMVASLLELALEYLPHDDSGVDTWEVVELLAFTPCYFHYLEPFFFIVELGLELYLYLYHFLCLNLDHLPHLYHPQKEEPFASLALGTLVLNLL